MKKFSLSYKAFKGWDDKKMVVWEHKENNYHQVPLLYITKPKWLSQEKFDNLADLIEIVIKEKNNL